MAKTVRTKKIEETILSRISRGDTLADICRDIGIDRTTVYGWRNADTEFDQRFARAREAGFDAIADDILTIIDADPERVTVTTGEDRTETRIDGASVQQAKNRAEIRLKLLAKWDPKRYGELIKLGNPDGSNLDLADRIAAGTAKVLDVDDE